MAQIWKMAAAARGLACLMVLALAVSPAAHAQESESAPGRAERLVEEGFSRMLEALDLLLKTVPQYAAPEIQPNGDIIIRRLQPDADEAPHKPAPSPGEDAAGDSTET